MLDEPAVRARCAGEHLPVGERIRARLVQADVATRTVHVEWRVTAVSGADTAPLEANGHSA